MRLLLLLFVLTSLACSRRLLRETGQHIKIPMIDEDRFDTQYPESQAEEPSSSGSGCPVYVMLPLDTVWVVERDGKRISVLKKERSLDIALHTLKQAGVEGVMVDVWWGIVERAGPRQYDFSAYKRLFYKVAAAGLKVQAVMSFHAAGGNVGDTCKIPLPKWVLEIGERNPDIFYTDKAGHRNRECLSLGCDEVPLFWGRTPVLMYRDFINAFADKFQHLFGEFSMRRAWRRRRPKSHGVPFCRDGHHGGHCGARAGGRAAVPFLPGGRRPVAVPGRGRVPVLRQVHARKPAANSGGGGARGVVRLAQAGMGQGMARKGSTVCIGDGETAEDLGRGHVGRDSSRAAFVLCTARSEGLVVGLRTAPVPARFVKARVCLCMHVLNVTRQLCASPCRGLSGPHDAGHYNSSSWETGFFVSQNGSWNTAYGHFFLSWYSNMLLEHADRVLSSAAEVLNKHGRPRVFNSMRDVSATRGRGVGGGLQPIYWSNVSTAVLSAATCGADGCVLSRAWRFAHVSTVSLCICICFGRRRPTGTSSTSSRRRARWASSWRACTGGSNRARTRRS